MRMATSMLCRNSQVSLAFATRFYDFLTEVDALKAELAIFSAQNAQCFCCSNQHLNPTTGEPLSCDRRLVNASIAHWHLGKTQRFAVVELSSIALQGPENDKGRHSDKK